MTERSALRITYGGERATVGQRGGNLEITVPVPCLGELITEPIPLASGSIAEAGRFTLLESDAHFSAFGAFPIGGDPALTTYQAYRELFSLIGGKNLHRIWNYLPKINEPCDSLEVYRHFNRGRWRAFEEQFGKEHKRLMPAASAVGAMGDELVILALGGTDKPTYIENPDQIPAYNYPPEHGPSAPGFARGSLVRHSGCTIGYLSGTASIIGHRSIGAGDLDLQFETTVSNVETMQHRMGFAQRKPQLKCYIRHAETLPKIQDLLRSRPELGDPASVIYLHADICRRELDLEMEAIYVSPISMGT